MHLLLNKVTQARLKNIRKVMKYWDSRSAKFREARYDKAVQYTTFTLPHELKICRVGLYATLHVSLLFAGLSSLATLVTFVMFFQSCNNYASIHVQYSRSVKADMEKPKIGKEPNEIRLSLSMHVATCR